MRLGVLSFEVCGLRRPFAGFWQDSLRTDAGSRQRYELGSAKVAPRPLSHASRSSIARTLGETQRVGQSPPHKKQKTSCAKELVAARSS